MSQEKPNKQKGKGYTEKLKRMKEKKKDFKNFIDFYGKGGIYENANLCDVTYKEFKKAFDESDQEEYDSITREILRDRILIGRGFDYLGHILSPSVKGKFGVEDLVEDDNPTENTDDCREEESRQESHREEVNETMLAIEADEYDCGL